MSLNQSIFSEGWCGEVFANRNQAYGAYQLRKSAPLNTYLAFFIITCFVLAGSFYGIKQNQVHAANLPKTIKDTQIDDPIIVTTVVMPLQPDPPAPLAAKPTLPPAPAMPTPPVNNTDIGMPQIVNDKAITNTDVAPPVNSEIASNGTATSTGTNTDAMGSTTIGSTAEGGGTDNNTNTFVVVAQEMPQYPGGTQALMQYIGSTTKYPPMAMENDIEGTVYISFVVDYKGQVGRVQVVRSVNRLLDNEAVRVIKSLPEWKPGKQNGKPVNVQFTVPIKFALN